MISVFWICGSWPEVLTISPFERILREQSWDGSKVITTISRGAWRNISQNGHLVALNLATNIPLIILPVSLSFTVYIIYCRSSIFDIVKFWFSTKILVWQNLSIFWHKFVASWCVHFSHFFPDRQFSQEKG